MKQIFIAGGVYNDPAKFSKTVNRNIQILLDSDRNAEIHDIKFTALNEPRYSGLGTTFLAYIIAEVDVDETEILNEKYQQKKKKHKKKY
ncbi:MAG: hypothetical protein ACTSPD_13730 [Promethearchaeota archaeon]